MDNNRPKCPLQGNCVKENVVYQAAVATETTTETYVGLASNFKERYRNHQTSFRHPSKRNETELSKYIWDLKDRKKSFHVKWRILRSCQPYSNVSKKCLQEKYFIIFRKDLSSLNKRNELASPCRNRNSACYETVSANYCHAQTFVFVLLLYRHHCQLTVTR